MFVTVNVYTSLTKEEFELGYKYYEEAVLVKHGFENQMLYDKYGIRDPKVADIVREVKQFILEYGHPIAFKE